MRPYGYGFDGAAGRCRVSEGIPHTGVIARSPPEADDEAIPGWCGRRSEEIAAPSHRSAGEWLAMTNWREWGQGG